MVPASSSKVTHFRKRAGMMRSVSISAPGTGTALPRMLMILLRGMCENGVIVSECQPKRYGFCVRDMNLTNEIPVYEKTTDKFKTFMSKNVTLYNGN